MPLRRLATIMVMVVAAGSSGPVSADFGAGYTAYERGDYQTALKEFSEAAKQGHAAAQVSLGWLYAQGLGVTQDDKQALYWYGRAAAQGHRDARAILDIRRLGSAEQRQEARHAFLDSGKRPQLGPVSRGDLATAVDGPSVIDRRPLTYWYRRAAEAGHRESQYLLGIGYELGRGVTQDDVRANYWYRYAAEQGLREAQFNLGLRYALGEGIPQSDKMALFWYRKAAAQGHTEAQFLVGMAYIHGGGTQDLEQGLSWLRKAAEGGYAAAQYHLGTMYARGIGVDEDHAEAYRWFRAAAAQGHEDARRSCDEERLRLGPAGLARLEYAGVAEGGTSSGRVQRFASSHHLIRGTLHE